MPIAPSAKIAMSHPITSLIQSDAMIQYQAYLERREAARKAERDEKARRDMRMKAFDAKIDTSLARQEDEENPEEDTEAGKEHATAQVEPVKTPDSADPFGPRWA